MAITRAHMNAYFKSGSSRCFDQGGNYAEMTDRTFGLLQHGAGLGREIALLRGDTTSADTCGRISDVFGGAASALGFARTVFPAERLVTGKMFWQRTDTDGTWKKVRVNADGTLAKDRNGYIEALPTDQSRTPFRDPISISMEVLSLAARVLSAVNFLHVHGAYDLGETHSKNISHATMGIWAAVIGLDMVQNVRELAKEQSTNTLRLTPQEKAERRFKQKKLVASTVCDGIDLVALPFDFGLLPFSPELRIVATIILVGAKGSYMVREATYG
ncbi:MAG: hypothetical protein S4CHLAM2_13920 [Chlamydiales bacterium]|nr:hypothetical protein [Chlamydiales bacterium]